MAYATQSGVAELCNAMGDVEGWGSAGKRWLVGIDHCRSDPVALMGLQRLGESEVRIHDGQYVVGRLGCVPRASFHPKLYIFHGRVGVEAVVGSGNLSCTGLTRGVEAGVLVGCERAELDSVLEWFNGLWAASTPLDEVVERYTAACDATENRRAPAPVEEDEVPENATGGRHLSAVQLRKLRVCRHLWIHAGRLHKNRGPGRPGNQLMMKRNSRVFFGFPAADLDPDTLVGRAAITYGGRELDDCSLRFSNNSMDVLTLPVPGDGGPPAYDEQVLCFRRTGVRCFELSVGSTGDGEKWRRRSERVSSAFRMTSGRAWGVY